MSGEVAIGVAGLGEVADAHLAGLAEVEGVRVAAVCDVVPERLEKAPPGAERFGDWRQMISMRGLDAVLVLLPHDLHHPVAAAALKAGRHVCLEKPMALNRGQCADLMTHAARAGRVLAVAENARFVAAYAAAAERLPELGRVRLARTFVHGSAVANYRREDAGWRIRRGGIGAVIDAAPHSFYLLRWLLGPVETVQASARTWVRDNLLPALEVEDGALVSGRLAAGGYFSCEVSLAAELPWGERLELHGEHGSLVVDQLAPSPALLHAGPADGDGTDLGVARDLGDWQGASIRAAARDFAEAVRDGRPPAVSTLDAAYAVELVDCAYRSIAEGGREVTPNGDV